MRAQVIGVQGMHRIWGRVSSLNRTASGVGSLGPVDWSIGTGIGPCGGFAGCPYGVGPDGKARWPKDAEERAAWDLERGRDSSGRELRRLPQLPAATCCADCADCADGGSCGERGPVVAWAVAGALVALALGRGLIGLALGILAGILARRLFLNFGGLRQLEGAP